MTYRGRVQNGVVVFDPDTQLPEGTEVEVAPLAVRTDPPTWAEVFKDIIGKAEGMPPDSSRNHDHYLYGVPKK